MKKIKSNKRKEKTTMKKCEKCGFENLSSIVFCEQCNAFLPINTAKSNIATPTRSPIAFLQNRINDIKNKYINKRNSIVNSVAMQNIKKVMGIKLINTKGTIIIISYVILAMLLVLFFILGFNRIYSDTYISKVFQEQKHSFEDLITLQNTYDKHEKEKEALEAEIPIIEEKLNIINEFETNQNKYNEEIKKLSEQLASLEAQKKAKEEEIKNLDVEIAKY